MDEILAVVVPVGVYWAYSGFYMLLEKYRPQLFERRRLHSKTDVGKNLVTPQQVVLMVLFQQSLQILLASVTVTLDKGGFSRPPPSLWIQVLQFIFACFVLDTWQYFMHRLFHESRYLYRTFHSWHHRLLVPYTFGALYNHPVEGFLMDSVGGALSFALTGMSPRNAIFFFSLATIKTVDDHCGIYTPYNPFHLIFRNNSAYHDVHHQVKGFRYNYSQPFLPFWDHVLGTYMPFTIVARPEGGIEARPARAVPVAPEAIEVEDSRAKLAPEGVENAAVVSGSTSSRLADSTSRLRARRA